MATISVLSPVKPATQANEGLPAGRAPIADGAVLTLVDNGKSHAKLVLEMAAEEIQAALPQISHVEIVSKPSAGATISDEEARRIAERSTLVVTGLGDCGACSSCSALDAIMVEKLGVPATVVITEPFVELVGKFAKTAGMPGYHSVVLPHPVATREDAEVRSLVEGIAEQIVDQLTAPAASRGAGLAAA